VSVAVRDGPDGRWMMMGEGQKLPVHGICERGGQQDTMKDRSPNLSSSHLSRFPRVELGSSRGAEGGRMAAPGEGEGKGGR